jgi:hypothetical protein
LAASGDLLQGFGFTKNASLDLSEKMVKLASDVASFKNVQGGAKEVVGAFNSALVGERERLKTLGIAILETDIKQRALEKGLKLVNGQVDRQNKALITAELIFEKSKNAVGDFARTQDNFANQSRILSANLENLATNLGTKLLPVFAPLIKILNSWLGDSKDLKTLTEELISLQGDYSKVIKELGDNTKNTNQSTRDTLKLQKAIIESKISEKLNEISERYEDITDRGLFFQGSLQKIENRLPTVNFNLERYGKALKDAKDKGLKPSKQFLDGYNEALQEQKDLTAAQASLELELKKGTLELAKAIKDKLITEEQLATLNPELVKAAKEKVKTVDAEIKKEKVAQRLRDRREANIKRAKEEAEAEKALLKSITQNRDALRERLEGLNKIIGKGKISAEQEKILKVEIERVTEKLKEEEEALKGNTKAKQDNSDANEELIKDAQDLTSKIGDAGKSHDDYAQNVRDGIKASGGMQGAIVAIIEVVAQLGGQLANLGKQIFGFAQENDKLGKDGAKSLRQLGRAFQAIGGFIEAGKNGLVGFINFFKGQAERAQNIVSEGIAGIADEQARLLEMQEQLKLKRDLQAIDDEKKAALDKLEANSEYLALKRKQEQEAFDALSDEKKKEVLLEREFNDEVARIEKEAEEKKKARQEAFDRAKFERDKKTWIAQIKAQRAVALANANTIIGKNRRKKAKDEIKDEFAPIISDINALQAFRNGGRVEAGVPIKVGEGGTEGFIPDQPGTIVPNDIISQMRFNSGANGGGVQNNSSVENNNNSTINNNFYGIQNISEARNELLRREGLRAF